MRIGALAGGLAGGINQGMDLIQKGQRMQLERDRANIERENADRAKTEFKWRTLDRDKEEAYTKDLAASLGTITSRFQEPAQATAIPESNGMTNADISMPGVAPVTPGKSRTPTPMDLAELHRTAYEVGARHGKFDRAALGDAFKLFEGEKSKEKEAAARLFFNSGDASGLMRFSKELGLPEGSTIGLTAKPGADGRPQPMVTITGTDGVERDVPAAPWLMSLGFLNQANAAKVQDDAGRQAILDKSKLKSDEAVAGHHTSSAKLADVQAAELPKQRAEQSKLIASQIKENEAQAAAAGRRGAGGDAKPLTVKDVDAVLDQVAAAYQFTDITGKPTNNPTIRSVTQPMVTDLMLGGQSGLKVMQATSQMVDRTMAKVKAPMGSKAFDSEFRAAWNATLKEAMGGQQGPAAAPAAAPGRVGASITPDAVRAAMTPPAPVEAPPPVPYAGMAGAGARRPMGQALNLR